MTKKKIRIICVLVGLPLLVLFFYAEENWRGQHTWENYKHALEAKGETFDYTKILPPAVPDDQNFALTPIVFTSYSNILTREGKPIPQEQRDAKFINQLKMSVDINGHGPTNSIGNWQIGSQSDLKPWQDYYRKLARTNTFPVPPQPRLPSQDVLLALSKYDSVIEQLRQASQLTHSRFPLNYDDEDPAEILLPHLATLKQCARVLQLRTIAELQNNQSEKAFEDIKLSFRLMDSIRGEPTLISHLVRIAMLQVTLQPVFEGLAEHQFTEAQMPTLELELARLDFLADYRLSMHGELAFQSGILSYLRRNPGQYLRVAGDASGYGHMTAAELMLAITMHWHLVPSGWFYQNQLHCGRAMETYYLPVADVNQRIFLPSLILQANTDLEKERENLTPFNILECFMLPGLGGTAKKFAHAQCSVDLARIAIALERYRLAHGEFPESLDVLAPQFIKKVPHDIIGGQPLHYRPTSDAQFILYSIGWNETDDDGALPIIEDSLSQIDLSEGDWVWRYPAK